MPIHVLYVEDNAFDRELVAHALLKDATGFRLTTAEDAGRFQSLIDDPTIDVVLTDFNILGMTGLQVLELVRQKRTSLPTIIVTGTGSEEIALEAMRQGADDYVIKTPQHIQRLPQTIQTVLDRRRAKSEADQATKALDREYALLRALAHTLPDHIFAKDSESRFLFVNEAHRRTLGIESVDDAIDKTDFNFFPEALASKYFHDERTVIETGTTVTNLEDAVVDSEGHTRWYLTTKAPIRNSHGAIEGIVGISRDVTELKHGQMLAARLAAAVEQVAESIVITDTEGRIEYVNPAFERSTGYSKREVLGKSPSILKSGKQDATFYRQLWDTIRAGGNWRGRFTNRRKDGTLFEEEATISPIRDQSGTICSYVAVKYDVTQTLMLERHLRQAQKLEAIGTLAGGIAHDFNNILASILGYTELVLMSTEGGGHNANDLRQVIAAAERARDLVAQIMTFSRHTEDRRAPLRLDVTVKEVAKLMQATLPSTVEVIYQLDPDLPLVVADVTQMQQTLVNLMTNAYQALPGNKGNITVTLRAVVLGPNEVPDTEPGPYLELTVADTGIGMNADTLDRIFEPFFTTKEVGRGTGLGLSAVHGIVRSHGGAVRVESQPGAGTTFHVYIPTAESEAAPLMPGPALRAASSARILIVDDEPSLAELISRSLTRIGYSCESTTSSKEAFGKIQSAQDGWDLLITDLTMPQMTGLELAKQVSAICPHLPIILTTGFSQLVEPGDAARAGIVDIVQKPANTAALASAVAKAIANRKPSR